MKLLYFTSLSIKSIMRNLTNNLLIIISLAIGMILPTIVFSYAYDSYKQVNGSKPNNLENILVIDSVEIWSEEDISNIKEYSDDIDFITSYGGFRSIIVGDKACSYSDVFYVDGYYGKMFGSERDNIIFFTPEEIENSEMLCVLGNNAAKELNLKQNDTININGFNLTVKEIVRKGKLSNFIYIPITCEQVIPSRVVPTHYVSFKMNLDKIDSLNKLLDYIKKEIGDFEAYCGAEVYSDEVKGTFTSYILLLLLSSSVLVYALVNIISMIFYKFDISQYRFGVEISLGATKRSIFLQCFIELFLISLCSSVIVLSIVPAIQKGASAIIEPIQFHYSVAIFLIIIVLMVSGILSMFLLKRIFKISISEILRS